MTGIDDLALAYLDYLADDHLHDVLVVGSSVGGWIGAEMAVRDNGSGITNLILIDAVGIAVEGEPIRDFSVLGEHSVAEHSFHDSARFYIDPATLSPERDAAQQANMAMWRVMAGNPYMHDLKLLRQLDDVRVPTLVLWGKSDRIVTPAYGAAYAKALPNARFELVSEAGHLPHIEQPVATFKLIDEYTNERL